MAIYTDNFDSYVDGELAGQGNWKKVSNAASGIVVADVAGDKVLISNGSRYSEVLYAYEGIYSNNQFAQIKIERLDGLTSSGGPCVRLQADGSGDGYKFSAESENWWLAYYDNNVWNNISNGLVSGGTQVGDVIRLEIEGTTLRGYINGGLVVTETNSVYSQGRPGVGLIDENSGTSLLRLDEWEGGDLSNIYITESGKFLTVQGKYISI